MIARIISGGQTGVDIAALRAAKRMCYPTGGTMPRGHRTLAGPKPEWAREFGLAEHAQSGYPPRTYQNVRDADMTIRIAHDFGSPGEMLTERAVDRYSRAIADIRVERSCGKLVVGEDEIFAAANKVENVFRAIGKPIVLNIAGNSERTAPGIEVVVEAVVYHLLMCVEAL